MDEFEYKTAYNLDDAWANFELDLPLKPEPDGRPNLFYVDRPGNPLTRLERELLRSYRIPPKKFFSGHRGCGKSTELRRLAAAPGINEKFWPVHFSIRDLADVNNLDFKDVLIAIGSELFTQYQQRGSKKLEKQTLKELDSWRGEIEEKVTIVRAGRMEGELEAKLGEFFAQLGGKIKLEPKTRHEVHQIFDRNVTGLVDVINKIATEITSKEKKYPLVLIDDLDKPDLKIAKSIFFERREIMLQPTCPIVYTVSSPLFYSPEFEAIRDREIFLPNVKLHEQGQPEIRSPEGYYTMRMFVHKRMDVSLITDEALDMATQMSGGVFREMSRVLRSSIDHALAAGRLRIETADVENAAAEIRSSYLRLLTAEQRRLLYRVRQENSCDQPEKLAPLLQLLAALEYTNGEVWYDAHPALWPLLDDLDPDDDTNDSG